MMTMQDAHTRTEHENHDGGVDTGMSDYNGVREQHDSCNVCPSANGHFVASVMVHDWHSSDTTCKQR